MPVRPVPSRLRPWPLTRSIPLLSAGMIFLVAVGTTQVALGWANMREERVLSRMAAIYLDGVTSALLPYAAQDDEGAAQALLERSVTFYEGLRDRVLRVRWIGRDGRVRDLRAGDASLMRPPEAFADPTAAAPLPLALVKDGVLAWATRRVVLRDGRLLEIQAALDVTEVHAERRRAQWVALGVDLGLAAVAALLGFLFTRSLVRPLSDLTRRLEGGPAAEGAAAGGPIPEAELFPPATEFGKLQRGINAWLAAKAERDMLQAQVAEQEKMLLLGKLAAGLAHEVRNPLAGLLTALSTLRRFGDDRAVREETVDLLERGLHSIGRVADAALSTYRGPVQQRPLTARDIDDLRLLVAPTARQRGVTLLWQAGPPPTVSVDAGRLRQILLNLLLNACHATGPGGTVRFQQGMEQGRPAFAVEDDGPGLPVAIHRLLTEPPDGSPATPPAGPGLGLWVVLRLADDIGAGLAVTTSPGRGTRIVLRLPAGSL